MIMNTQQVANRLVELCRQGEIQKAMEDLYADSIVSNEPAHSMVKSASGKKAVFEKGRNLHRWLSSAMAAHSPIRS